MSVVPSHRHAPTRAFSLGDILLPMEFKTVLLLAHGLTNYQIAQVLGTTEQVIKNALRDVFHRSGCRDSGELACRYFRELANGLLELGRLRRELAELDARATLIFKSLS
jgi:DNA-binding NarL/FixJ family response regulator